MAKRKRRTFTPEFKADAVRLTKAGGRTIGQVAKELDLTETALGTPLIDLLDLVASAWRLSRG